MRVFVFLVLVLGSVFATPTAAKDEKPLVFEPSTPWVMDYAEDSCALRRRFSQDNEEIVLELRSYDPVSTSYQTIVASNSRKPEKAVPKYRYSPATDWVKWTSAMHADFGSGWRAVILTTSVFGEPEVFADGYEDQAPNAAEINAQVTVSGERRAKLRKIAANVENFSIKGAFDQEVVLETGPLDQPLDGLHACMDELLTHWGVDLEAHKALTRKVAPLGMSRWVKKIWRDYPSRALREGRGGIVRVRLGVGSDGKPTSCNVQSDLAGRDFERVACERLERHARFKPALDADGDPIDSFWLTSVRYTT